MSGRIGWGMRRFEHLKGGVYVIRGMNVIKPVHAVAVSVSSSRYRRLICMVSPPVF